MNISFSIILQDGWGLTLMKVPGRVFAKVLRQGKVHG